MLKVIVLLCFALYVASDTPSVAYNDLPLIPGTDFVGFGYDVRYIDDPNQGLRLPLIELNYKRAKQYVYPLYRSRVYKVADEFFVRTVATATAVNYEFDSIESYKENWAAQLGLHYERESTVPMAPDQVSTNNSAASQGNSASNKPSLSGGFSNATANQQAGLTPTLPAGYATTSSGMFGIGVDFQFRKNMMKDSSQITVQNKQTHQLYQLMINDQNVRTSMFKDIAALSGKKYLSDKTLYKSFFEKYGTHFVQSALLGGAIELNSIVSNVKETDFMQITANATIEYFSNSSNANNTNVTQELIKRSPKCTKKEETGYSYDTYKEACVEPPEVTRCTIQSPEADNKDTMDYDINTFNGNVNETLSTYAITKPDVSAADKKKAYHDQPWRRGPNPYTATACGKLKDGITTNCQFSQFANILKGNIDKMDKALYVDATQQNAGAELIGVSRLWVSSTPTLIQWKQYVVKLPLLTTQEGVNFRLSYEGDSSIRDDDRVIFGFALNGDNGDLTQTLNPNFRATGNNAAVSYTHVGAYPKIPTGTVINFAVYLDWEKYTVELWMKAAPSTKFVRLLADVPFRDQVTSFERMDIFHKSAGSGKTYFTDFALCNAAGGSKYQPLTKGSRVGQSTANMRTKLAGQIDFGFQTNHVNSKISESSNYKLKGGDSSLVDLLNTRNAVDTFTKWKETIPQNPAPVGFALRSIAYLFQKDKISVQDAASETPYLISPRAEMEAAIKDFLVTVEVGEISYLKAADTPTEFSKSNIQPPLNTTV